MTELSPITRAVLDAFNSHTPCTTKTITVNIDKGLAESIRVAVNIILPDEPSPEFDSYKYTMRDYEDELIMWETVQHKRSAFLDIISELNE